MNVVAADDGYCEKCMYRGLKKSISSKKCCFASLPKIDAY